MRPRLLLFTVFAAAIGMIGLATPSSAGLRVGNTERPRMLGDIVLPPEWAGVWTYLDSTYDCTGALLSVDSGLDTLCTGTVISFDSGPFVVVCTGSSTATTIDQTCTFTGEVVTDCNVTFTIEMHGTRTASSSVITNTVTTDYSGIAPECAFLPDSCRRTVTRANRIASEPVAYCSTPVDPTTWGRVKSRYR